MLIIQKIIYNQKIEYLFWGAITTLIYFMARFTSMMMTDNSMIPVAFAQIMSIVFAFIVNKYLVFNDDNQSKAALEQFLIFIGGRAIAAGLDFLLTFLMIDRFYRFFIQLLFLNDLDYHLTIFKLGLVKSLMGTPILMNSFLCVVFIQVIIIIINYIISKYFAFK